MSNARPPLVVHDARTNNLTGVTVSIPSPALTVVTGVSGSGKSSLVFETIAKESQRQLNEVFPLFIRNRLPKFERPDFERMENMAPAIVVDQRNLGRSARSTVGTLTEVQPMLRVLFSRHGKPSAGESTAYSFNAPEGMCPECEGLGEVLSVDIDRLLDESKSLNEGAIQHPNFAVGTNYWKRYATAHFHVKQPSETLGEPLFDADLGYLTLGRSLSELSGGERQRVKLASRLTDHGRVFVFDEPTSGLHMADVRHLIDLFDRIIAAGNTVIVIEHDLDVVRVADWVIDLGPGAGTEGGRIVFEGRPADLTGRQDSLTGRYLAKERAMATG